MPRSEQTSAPLSDLEITTYLQRRSPARSSSRSCSRSSTWWSSTAAIAAGVLLVLGLSAAAGCLSDGEMGGSDYQDTDTEDRECEEYAVFYCECFPDDCQNEEIEDGCEDASFEWWQCIGYAGIDCQSLELYLVECDDL